MQKLKLILAAALFSISSAQAQYQTQLLSYTTLSIVTTDLDKDGDQDILSGGFNNLQWQENSGNRLFLSHTITQNQDEVQSAVAADLDMDGDMDVITASFDDDRIYWMKNDGNQNFTSVVLTSNALGAASVNVIDLDNDGDSDIVCAAFEGDKIFWLQNNGSQNFILNDILTTCDGPNTVISCDFDQDGDMDLAAASQLDSTIVWLQNDGSENFTPYILISNLLLPRNLNLADIDNDLDMDLFYASSGGSGWFYNSAGVFTQHISTTGDNRDYLAVDLDNDTYKDVLTLDYYNDQLTWAKNNGNQTFVHGAYLDFGLDNVSMVAAADFDLDGNMDVIGASGFDVKVFWNSPSHTFTKVRLNRYLNDANYACDGDFDNDGDVDLMAIGYFNINFYRNEGGGIFTTLPVFPITVSFAGRQIRAADMDGDGDVDAVYTEQSGNLVAWLENQGGGVFLKRTIVSIIDPYAVYPIDFDFDGDMDVVASRVQSTSTSAIFWYENDGSENFTQHFVDANYHYGLDVFPVDYNMDGYMDVIGAYAGSAGSQKVVLHYNSAAGFNNTNYVLNSNAPGVNSVFAIDIDRDLDVDVLSANYTNNTIIWYENPGQIQHVIDNNAQGATYVYAADLDNDGDIDVASTSRTDDEINWYRNNGNQSFTKINIAQNIPDPEVILACDVDSDNVLELYSTCSTSSSVALYKLPPPPEPLVLSDCSQLFISEYIEGSSNNKAIEIYNPTSDTINLSGYQLIVCTNGNGSANQTVDLVGDLLPFDVYVVAHPSAIPAILNAADTTFGFNFNGDDAISLLKNGNRIDIIGKIGEDPGTEWSNSNVSTLNATLVRNAAFAKGSNTNQAFNPSIQWTALVTDDASNLGSHTSLCTSYCPPSILITASSDTICAATPVTFTTSTSNEGATPNYQWKINGNPVGTDSIALITSALADNDIVSCTLTSSLACSISPVSSNNLKIKVNSITTPAVVISTPSTILCSSAPINFSAAAVNPGSDPIFIWKKNGNLVGGNTANYTLAAPANNDVITCNLVTNAPCTTLDTAMSNAITITVTSTVMAAVTITSTADTICPGASLTFIATPLNGGVTPSFQWTAGGNPIAGATSSSYTTNSITANTVIACKLTSSLVCVSNPVATSNSVSVTVSTALTPAVSIASNVSIICKDWSIIFTASPSNGGSSPGYQWRNNGNPIGGQTAATYTTTTLTNGSAITCTLTSSETCTTSATANSNSLSIQVLPLPSVVLSANGNLLSTTSFVFYKWLRNNTVISGATSQSYTATQNGNYRVIGWSNSNGCDDTSNTVSLTSVGIADDLQTSPISISPNPGNGIFTLTFATPSNGVIEVMDLLGKQIYYQTISQNNLQHRIDICGKAKGLYFLCIQIGEQKIIRRIVVE